ncbi:MAG: twitching motility two-component system response regulator PilH, partial [Pseudomonadota bacterium]|nr:twitching motility two-component system response regulator PilH [Pseudomonadota bacterium]
MAKILVVDDSPTQLHSLTKILQKHGHQVLVAENGERAIECASADLPDLILMDVVMPGLNGFQATRQISKNTATQHIPIIMLSSKDQDTDRLWAQRQGASDYIVKPAEEAELMGKIKSLL